MILMRALMAVLVTDDAILIDDAAVLAVRDITYLLYQHQMGYTGSSDSAPVEKI